MLDVPENRDIWYEITTTSATSSPSGQLRLLEALNEKTEVHPAAEVPFEFDVLDTPNKGIAIAVTKMAIAAETFNKGVSSRNLSSIETAKNTLEEAITAFPSTEETLVPPIVRDGWIHNMRTLIILSRVKEHPRPPQTMIVEQYVEMRRLLMSLYNEASQITATPRWRDDVLRFTKNQTMRITAHHLEFALAQEMQKIDKVGSRETIISTETVAKRQCEILALLDKSGFTGDSIYTKVKKDFDIGYRLSLGGYQPILPDQIISGRFFGK